MSEDLHQAAQRKLNFFQTLKAIAWAFFGVRKGAGYSEDISRLNPVHVILAGLLGAVIFVVVLVMIVRWAVSSLT
ncbi:DUF2970 domain-containing protein [Bordetella pseudohinzii]|uniref:Protein of uncharacterized function (DUF2970) n=1 Tax=Bordetella pseudohinzii TaxID=1331258 RepID=A0A0J6CBC9_9BORD|nr:DUF2970 domain-containing protein [Bordetella pseudohinzii]ANY14555.1 hypothetical protein BBN53_00805 [Bordetella pseudohinzii]KMM26742.1 membrane protein [Bordetella pseudohinzii]KXA79928.1 hypothetical protein AW877_07915 [Bordetella pseudohinzii]KXA81101.1 hypothetical protein AW878_05785 [Bordetella pseudohinzii]CUI62971.1 Protein of uncharacterised function (DUF2970) [Bordetella pseudohinzii]